MKSTEYLTTEELAERIRYDARTIRERLKDAVLLEGVHYIRSAAGRFCICGSRLRGTCSNTLATTPLQFLWLTEGA